MKASKQLSKSDREEILEAVRIKATAKWESSPLFREMKYIEDEAATIIRDKQLTMIPAKDRKVLDKYGYSMREHRVQCFIDTGTGEVRGSWAGIAHFTIEKYCSQSTYRPGYPDKYPHDNDDFVRVINAVNPALLRRYCKLWNLRDCEVNTAVKAFGNLLACCNTTKQVYENESLRPFMSAWMLDYEKPIKANAPALPASDAAIIADLIAKEG
jgi:hypothetical protein